MQAELQLEIIGTGNAYDAERVNASALVSEGPFQLLIDCGPGVPAALFARSMEANALDAIYLTHAHPDHCLGLTTLLNWMDTCRRQRPLQLIAQRQQWPLLESLIKHAHWPQSALSFALERCHSETLNQIGPWQATTSTTRHSVNNRSLHLTNAQGRQLFYSGDGRLSAAGEALAMQSDWVILECEGCEPHPSHGSWQEIAMLKRKAGSEWRLTHVDAAQRPVLASLLSAEQNIALARQGEILSGPLASGGDHQ